MHATQEPLHATRHLPFGSAIDVRGDSAPAWTDTAVTLHGADGTAQIAWLGRYHDDFRREQGSWRFRHHVALAVGEQLPDGASPMSLAARGPQPAR